jgi:hypothetical protein
VLSAIFEQATKSVTRTVLYAGVIPVAATLLLNLLISTMLLGEGAVTIFNDLLNRSATAMVGWVATASLLLIIAGIAVAAMAPIFRALLEGRSRLATLLGLAPGRRAAVALEERRAQGERAKALLARRLSFRTAQEAALAEAREKALRTTDPSPSIIADVERRVSDALAADEGEDGVSQAATVLMQHFRRNGKARTQFAHNAILDRLDALVRVARDDISRAWRLSPDIPSSPEPLTRYGHRLQYVETYVASVYNIDSIVFWVRLNHVIATPFAARLEDAKHSLDLLTAATVLLWASTLVWFVVLPFAFPGWGPLIGIATSGGLLGYVTYVSATAAALSFAELVCAAFDLFRRDLLVELGIEPPLTLREERALWLKLGQLTLYQQVPDDLTLMPAKRPLLTMGSSSLTASGSNAATGSSTIVVPDAGAR